jgi:hypothetical protein
VENYTHVTTRCRGYGTTPPDGMQPQSPSTSYDLRIRRSAAGNRLELSIRTGVSRSRAGVSRSRPGVSRAFEGPGDRTGTRPPPLYCTASSDTLIKALISSGIRDFPYTATMCQRRTPKDSEP